MRQKIRKVPHPTFEDERRPLPTQGEAIRRERKFRRDRVL
jgi:hypothetical protein